MLEFSTSEGKPIDAEAWIDPEVVKLACITPADLERYKNPPAFESRGGAVAQPTLDPSKPHMEFPPGMEKIYHMSDEEITTCLSEPTPPVKPKR
jgi:hypothetical protein